MTHPTFFLGLGGQKCGSSWMQAYLARQPGSDFGRLGEYQVWEADLGGPFARYKVPMPSLAAKLRGEAKRRLGLPMPADYLRWRMQTDRTLYFDYFARLLARKGIGRTGDITPSYAALPSGMLAGIRDGFASRGIGVKVLFSMRDPVARLVSHLRMDQQKGRLAATGDMAADLAAFYPGPEAAARMRYDMTLGAIAEVFAPEDTHICLFETLFTETGIRAFARFADVAVEPAAGGEKVNARAAAEAPVPDALAAGIARHYAPVYHAAAAIRPEVAQLWPSARFVADLAAGGAP